MTDRTHDTRAERRRLRALEQRRRALSPVRVMLRILGIPFVAAAVATSLYFRTSPWPPQVALAHLVALGGCASAESVGLAPARRGEPGYHARNDPDGDGLACGNRLAAARPGSAADERRAGGARFVRP